MATVKGTNKTLIDTGGMASQLAAGLENGRVKCSIDQYVAAGSETAGTVIEFCGDLPAGAKIIEVVLSSSVAQSSLTLALGTSYNDDEFLAAGNTTLQAAATAAVADGKGYVVGTAALDSQIIVTTAAATMTAGTIYCTVKFTTD